LNGTDPLPQALLVHTTPGRKAILCGVWVVHGSAHEPPEAAGATHLVEHLTLRRCGTHDRRSLARLVDRLGGEVDAWTSFEMMGVTVQTTADAFDDAVGLLVDAVMTPTFDPVDVELERRVSLAELELIRDDPVEQVEEAIAHAAWGNHPLARPVIGSAKSLAALTPEALRAHHRTMTAPGRMLAAVVGDVHPAGTAQSLRRLPLDQMPTPPQLPPLRWRASHRVLRRAGIDQAHARIAFPTMASGDPRVVVLGVLNRILGVGASSRLFQRLREDEGLTYDIWSAPALRRLGGMLVIGWACTPDVYPDVRRLVLEELTRCRNDIDADEVELAKEGMMRGLVADAELPAARCAMDVAEVLERGRRFDPETAAAEISGVTSSDVSALADSLLRPERMAAAVCGPEGLEIQVA
jgi:predicted Zn-dependent peptidase